MKRKRGVYIIASITLLGVFCAVGQFSKGQANENSRGHDDDRSDLSKIRQGYAISPVPLNLAGKNRALVGLGSYIVNAQGGCNDCHTSPPYAPGHDPFKGEPGQVNPDTYLGGGVSFGPDLISPNITPNQRGLPAGLTHREFMKIMSTGVDQEGHILQVMPWPVYSNMTDRDLSAIYEYLRSIPSLPGNRD